jgi:hypothetical protein
MKKLIITAATTLISVLLISAVGFASPERLAGDEKSTARLIELSKPEDDVSTFSDLCIVSGKARHGVKVTIYVKDSKDDTYEKLLTKSQDQDMVPVSWTVGVSGVFAKEIKLERNKVNDIIIYAEKDDECQIINRKITVKNLYLKQILKNGVVNLQGLINRIIKD